MADDEILAIRWHIQGFDLSDSPEAKGCFTAGGDKCPLLARLKKDYAKRHVSLRLNVKLGNEGAERFYNRFGFGAVAELMRREFRALG